MSPKLKNMMKNIWLALFMVLITLFCADIAVRLVLEKPRLPQEHIGGWAVVPERTWTTYDETLGWLHLKNKKAILIIKDLQIPITTNSIGLRGTTEYEKDKPQGKTRILLLGDSFFFGWGVHDEETLSAQLEKKIDGLEAINFGVAGYGIDQILLSFRKFGQAFKPDCVIVGIFPEQFWRSTRAFTDAGYAKPYFSLSKDKKIVLNNALVPKPYESRHDQFPELIKRSPLEKILLKSALYRYTEKGVSRMGKNLGWIDPDTTEEWLLGKAILEELVNDVHNSGSRLLFLIVPPKRWVENKRLESIHKSIIRFAERKRIDLIDLTPIFREAIGHSDITDYYIKDDWHWTAKGHELVAQIILEYLKKNRIV